MTGIEALKAGGLILLATLIQVSLAEWIEVGEGHPDVVLVTLVAVALLRGPVFGAVGGFTAGLVLDASSFVTFGMSSLLLTIAGYWTGRFGEVTTRTSVHPLFIAVALATTGVTLGSAVLHFMLGETIAASQLFVSVLVPSLALNMLLAYPLYSLCARFLPPQVGIRREVSPAV